MSGPSRYERSLEIWSAALAVLVAMLVASLLPPVAGAQTFSVLYAFQGGTEGATPTGRLILDESGNLYGTTENGGNHYGFGTVYKVDTAGNETILYGFTGKADGGEPYGGLVRDAAGNLYGTTDSGGNSGCGGDGCGVVFKLDTSGNETVLYQFSGGSDGGSPNGDLVLDQAGNLYGTAYWGPYGYGGVVFKVDTNGNEAVLHEFNGLPDGEFPAAGVVRDQNGNIFGTTSGGGGGPCFGGCGTVFRVSQKGKENIVYRFLASPDGEIPLASLALGISGNLYGTTHNGGRLGCPGDYIGVGCGTVFEVNASGRERVLYRFRGNKKEGLPFGGVSRDKSGTLYGTTAGDLLFGHADFYGTVFKLDAHGKETVLHRFSGGFDGCTPNGNLTFDSAGNLYGVASECGANGYGVVYKIAP